MNQITLDLPIDFFVDNYRRNYQQKNLLVIIHRKKIDKIYQQRFYQYNFD